MDNTPTIATNHPVPGQPQLWLEPDDLNEVNPNSVNWQWMLKMDKFMFVAPDHEGAITVWHPEYAVDVLDTDAPFFYLKAEIVAGAGNYNWGVKEDGIVEIIASTAAEADDRGLLLLDDDANLLWVRLAEVLLAGTSVTGLHWLHAGTFTWILGGGGVEGFWVYRGNTLLGSVAWSVVFAQWKAIDPPPSEWSLEFGVTASALDAFDLSGTPANPRGVEETDLFDGDASNLDGNGDPDPIAQTFYSIPLRRDNVWMCKGGVFQEEVFCTPTGSKVRLVRIG